MMTTHFLGDTAVLTGRSLRHILRSPDTIITTAVTPVALCCCSSSCSAARSTPDRRSYIDYMLPGILLITIASGIAYTAYRLFIDLQGGIFERFQSMPIARSSALWAHVLTSLVANLDLARDRRRRRLASWASAPGAGVLAWLAVAGILILFTLALTWLAVIAGLSAKTVDGASAFSYPLIFLPFISSAFVPTDTMPAPVAWFAENQPVTSDRQHDRATCSPGSRSATTSGSRSPGASASSSSPTSSRWRSTAARSARSCVASTSGSASSLLRDAQLVRGAMVLRRRHAHERDGGRVALDVG